VASPLNVITMGFENLASEALDKEGQETLLMAQESTRHISISLKDILKFQARLLILVVEMR
jgi:hypothetical protein